MKALYSCNADLLGSITLLYIVNKKDKYDDDLFNELSLYIKNIIKVSSFKEACDILEKSDIDIVIMDFISGDIESMGFPAFCRNKNPLCHIIVYTANEEPEHILDAIDLQIDKYIVKPTPHKEIMRSIISIADTSFTLKHLGNIDNNSSLDSKTYDVVSKSIDDLRAIITTLSTRHCPDSMDIIYSCKNIINDLKTLVK